MVHRAALLDCDIHEPIHYGASARPEILLVRRPRAPEAFVCLRDDCLGTDSYASRSPAAL